MTYGVTATGFVQKTLAEIKEEIEEAQRNAISPALNQSSQSVLGVLNGIFASKVAELWEVAAAVYRANFPDSATGEALDNVMSITGAKRLAATKSTATLTCTGTAGTVLPAGRIVSVSGAATKRFTTLAEVTIGAGGTVDVAAECETTGPVTANAGTLTVIETAVTGWTAVTNALDAVIGRDIESDEDARLRRENLLRITGSGTLEAIRSDVLDVSGVVEAIVFENTSDVTDSELLPPHSIEAVVQGGSNADVAEALWLSKGASIATHGNTTQNITDSQGVLRAIKFTRPEALNVYVIVEVTTDPDNYPVNGDTLIKEAIVNTYGSTLGIGDSVVQTAIYPKIFAVPGVIDVTKLWIGFSDPPTEGANLSIALRQYASFDTSRVEVTAT